MVLSSAEFSISCRLKNVFIRQKKKINSVLSVGNMKFEPLLFRFVVLCFFYFFFFLYFLYSFIGQSANQLHTVFHLFFCCWLLVLNTLLTSSAFRFLPDNSISFMKLVCFKFLLSKESHVANAILIIKVLHGLQSGTNSSTISGMTQCYSTSPETMRLIRDGEPIVVKART